MRTASRRQSRHPKFLCSRQAPRIDYKCSCHHTPGRVRVKQSRRRRVTLQPKINSEQTFLWKVGQRFCYREGCGGLRRTSVKLAVSEVELPSAKPNANPKAVYLPRREIRNRSAPNPEP